MLLSARLLNAVSGVNAFEQADTAQFNQGDVTNVYFQLIDASLDTAAKAFNPAGRRYMPASGATLQVTLTNIDDAKQIVRAGVMAFPTDDRSIWYLPMLSTDAIAGTCDMVLKLTEGAKVTTGRVAAAVRIGVVTGAFC
jgi:hypothetical protein